MISDSTSLPISSEDLAFSAEEVQPKQRFSLKQLGECIMSYAMTNFGGVATSPEDVHNFHLYNIGMIANELHGTFEDWRDSSAVEKIKRPVIGSLSWANLIFGETIALFVQGTAQSGNASHAESLAVGIGTALAIEIGFTTPIAAHNKEPQSTEDVAEAMATAFWLGGAMGVENKKLPLRQAPWAIGSYMIFGTALAAAGEYNNTAEHLLDHKEIILPILIGWAAMKKANEYFGYKGVFERLADKTVGLVRRLTGRTIVEDEDLTK